MVIFPPTVFSLGRTVAQVPRKIKTRLETPVLPSACKTHIVDQSGLADPGGGKDAACKTGRNRATRQVFQSVWINRADIVKEDSANSRPFSPEVVYPRRSIQAGGGSWAGRGG